MLVNNFSWKIGGEAGYGIKSIGALLAKSMMRLGLFVFTYDEYPSLIRGGHNAFEVAVSSEPVHAPKRPINILVALDQTSLDQHLCELADDAAIIYNAKTVKVPSAFIPKKAKLFPLPLQEIVSKLGGEKIMNNTVAWGATMALLDVDLDFVKTMIESSFETKDPKIILQNIKVASEGFEYLRRSFSIKDFGYKVEKKENPGRMLMTGNEAIVWGAIRAGCQMYAGYPMTPSTSILHTMVINADEYGIICRQTEDEISAVNMAIGAGYAGLRSMTATSGGGFALMAESLGLAAILEVPLVIVEAMRPGPSTGLPTWSGQGDLRFVLGASQDEFPRFVLAPGDVEQCLNFLPLAFNLAEKYQTPVVVITDKYLAESYKSIDKASIKTIKIERGEVLGEDELAKIKEYKRYAFTESGVSPRSLPGTKGGLHLVNSDEHDEFGFSDENSETRVRMMDKRFRKIESAKQDLPLPILEGGSHADITLVGWGSTRGVILETLKSLENHGIRANFLQIVCLSPFPREAVINVLKKSKKIAIVENNKTGQLAGWLKENTGLDPNYKVLKYDGRPFFIEELTETIKEFL